MLVMIIIVVVVITITIIIVIRIIMIIMIIIIIMITTIMAGCLLRGLPAFLPAGWPADWSMRGAEIWGDYIWTRGQMPSWSFGIDV